MENFGKRLKRPEKYKYIEREINVQKRGKRKRERGKSRDIMRMQ